MYEALGSFLRRPTRACKNMFYSHVARSRMRGSYHLCTPARRSFEARCFFCGALI